MFALDVSLVASVLLWSVCRSRLICICIDRFSNSITFEIVFFTMNVRNLLKLSVSPSSRRGLGPLLTLIVTYISELLFWFKVESHWFSCRVYIGSYIINLIGLFIPLYLSTGNSFINKSFEMTVLFVTLIVSKPESQGHPTTIFGEISVRKTIWDLEFSEHLL